jgi:putative peptidoglycan lipid II flippase
VVPVLGLGTTFGLTVSGIALLFLVYRECGAAALRGVPRAFLAGLAGCVGGAAAGTLVSYVVHSAVPSPTASEILVNVGLSVLAAVVVTGVFGLVVLRLDSGDIRTALSRLRTRPSP